MLCIGTSALLPLQSIIPAVSGPFREKPEFGQWLIGMSAYLGRTACARRDLVRVLDLDTKVEICLRNQESKFFGRALSTTVLFRSLHGAHVC